MKHIHSYKEFLNEKKEEEKDIEVVKEALNVSSRRANELLDILTEEDMDILRSRVFKGGVK